ncbi:MAG: ABC transporter transmembrane domain-containing protein [Alphaproteobacteria bacterium]
MSAAIALGRRERSAGRLADLFLSTVALYSLSLALPIMTLQIYDRILPSDDTGTLTLLIAGVLVALALECTLRLMRAYMIGWAGAAFEHRVACAAIEHLMAADLSRLPSHGVAGSVHRMAAIGQLKDFFSGQAITTMIEVGFVAVFLGLIAYVAGHLALVPIAVILIFGALVAFLGVRLNRRLRARGETDDLRYDFLIETLRGIHTIKAMALERLFSRRYEAFEASSCRANYAVARTASTLANLGTVAAHVMIASVVGFGALMVIDRTLSVGALIASLLLSGRLMQPVQKALHLWIQYQGYRLIHEQAASLFSVPTIARPDEAPSARAKQGELILQDVGFGFADDDWLFRHVDLELRPGETVTLSGDKGSGKSALLKLIAGVYPPGEGRVLIDGSPTVAFAPEELMSRVGLISTDGLIFRGTVRDNITRFGVVPEAQAVDVAKLLGIDKDLARLPDGFGTRLEGTLADGIPPGLKQRIAMTRALALKPKVILFDNADRGIDQQGYNLLFSLLGRVKPKVAMIIVSDDLNLQGLASRHLILGPDGLTEDDRTAGSRSNVQFYRELRV